MKNRKMVNNKLNCYEVEIDKGEVFFRFWSDADYETIYLILVKWFLKERYSGEYDTIDEFIESNGYIFTQKDNVTVERYFIDLNLIMLI